MLKRVDYDERQYAVYARARAISAPAMAVWVEAFARHVSPRRPLTVLDLGSGIGRFTPALAEEFGGPVYGVEPSSRMRAIAQESARHDRVTYLDGAAGRIPLPDRSCDVVLLFLVLHHVPDKAAAAAEIDRVLAGGGRVLIRSTFPGRSPAPWWHRYFPRTGEIEARMFPAFDEVVRVFGAAGLRPVTVERVRQRFAESRAEYAARLRLRGISTFEHLTEEEITAGFAALDADVAAETTPQPVEGDCDVLVLGRDGS